jgi:hypothetical protein
MRSREILRDKQIYAFTVHNYLVSGYFQRSEQGKHDFIYSYDPEIEDNLEKITEYWNEEKFIHFTLKSLGREPYDDEALVVTRINEIT